MTTEELIYQAIREVCKTDNPERFTEMNRAVFEVAKKVAELMAAQERAIWKSSRTILPEGIKSQILSFDDEGYFYLGRNPHPDSVEWCFAEELLPEVHKK